MPEVLLSRVQLFATPWTVAPPGNHLSHQGSSYILVWTSLLASWFFWVGWSDESMGTLGTWWGKSGGGGGTLDSKQWWNGRSSLLEQATRSSLLLGTSHILLCPNVNSLLFSRPLSTLIVPTPHNLWCKFFLQKHSGTDYPVPCAHCWLPQACVWFLSPLWSGDRPCSYCFRRSPGLCPVDTQAESHVLSSSRCCQLMRFPSPSSLQPTRCWSMEKPWPSTTSRGIWRWSFPSEKYAWPGGKGGGAG